MSAARKKSTSARISLGMAGVGLVLVTLWAVMVQPPATLLEHRLLGEKTVFDWPEELPNRGWWRLKIDLDPELEGGPPWSVVEAAPAGERDRFCYELQWAPDQNCLRLVRHAEGLRLLASVRVPSVPERIEWTRRDDRHVVSCDGREVITCLDLLPRPPGERFAFASPAKMGDSILAIHDHSQFAPKVVPGKRAEETDGELPERIPDGEEYAEKAPDPHEVKRWLSRLVEHAAHTQAPPSDKTWLQVGALSQQMPEAADVAQANAWYGWAYGRAMIRQDHGFVSKDIQASLRLLDHLGTSGRGPPPPQITGIHLDFTDLLTREIDDLPEERVPVHAWIAHRQDMFVAIAAICGHVGRYEPVEESDRWGSYHLADEDRYDLALLRHAARCLAGQTPDPTPAHAPSWLVQRWHALAGSEPLPDELEPLPVQAHARPWIRRPLERILEIARIDRLALVRARAAVLGPSDGRSEGIAWALREKLPERERLLLIGLLAVAGHLDPGESLQALAGRRGEQPPLKDVDPLAYALWRLIHHRHGLPAPVAELPPGLSPWSHLLVGGEGDLRIAFGSLAPTLTPSQAVAAALAMREVRGEDPHWELLRQIPSMNLPLEFLLPERRDR